MDSVNLVKPQCHLWECQ